MRLRYQAKIDDHGWYEPATVRLHGEGWKIELCWDGWNCDTFNVQREICGYDRFAHWWLTLNIWPVHILLTTEMPYQTGGGS